MCTLQLYGGGSGFSVVFHNIDILQYIAAGAKRENCVCKWEVDPRNQWLLVSSPDASGVSGRRRLRDWYVDFFSRSNLLACDTQRSPQRNLLHLGYTIFSGQCGVVGGLQSWRLEHRDDVGPLLSGSLVKGKGFVVGIVLSDCLHACPVHMCSGRTYLLDRNRVGCHCGGCAGR